MGALSCTPGFSRNTCRATPPSAPVCHWVHQSGSSGGRVAKLSAAEHLSLALQEDRTPEQAYWALLPEMAVAA